MACGGLAVALSLPGSASAEDRTPLRWAADEEGGAPYIFKDPNNPGKRLGFEVDLAAALEKELGRLIVFQQYEFDALLSGLTRGKAGDFDFAMNGLEITPERKEQVRFTRPYYVYRMQLVARGDESRFHSLDDCRGRKDLVIGTLGGSAGERSLDRRSIPKKTYSDQVGPYKDLTLGRIDGVVMDLPIALYFTRPDLHLPYANSFSGLKFVGPAVDEGYYAIAVRQDNELLAQALDVALERLLQSGELQRIYINWGLWNDDQEKLRLGAIANPSDTAESWTFPRYFPLLLDGAAVTCVITLFSMLLAIAIGMPIALGRLYGPWPIRALAVSYIEFFRGIPVLLLLYFLYYGLPDLVGIQLSPLYAAILGFGINYAAYEAEIYRAGIMAIPVGQWEAAASLGMRPALTFRRIILPQAIKTILPPATNDLVALFKDTSVVSIIAVTELSKQYQILSKNSFKYVEIGLATAALYLIMSVPLGHLSRYLEKRWSKNGT
jgi:polar amino acid transport system substrate-binding protein